MPSVGIVSRVASRPRRKTRCNFERVVPRCCCCFLHLFTIFLFLSYLLYLLTTTILTLFTILSIRGCSRPIIPGRANFVRVNIKKAAHEKMYISLFAFICIRERKKRALGDEEEASFVRSHDVVK